MPVLPVDAYRNTSLVTFTILIEGEAIPSRMGVASIMVAKEVNRIPYANIVLSDGDVAKQDFPVSNEDLFVPGKKIEISAGYNSDETVIFKGIIIKHGIKIRQNGNAVLIIDCKDEAVKMTIGRKSKYFYESKDSDVIAEIIDTYKLQKEIEDTETTHPELVQYRATDWDFMLTRVEVNGKICVTNDGLIQIQNPDFNQSPAAKFKYGNNIRAFEANFDAREQFNSVKAQAWDFGTQEMITTEATEPHVADAGDIDAGTLADVVGLDAYVLAHGGKANEGELQAWADAKLLRNRMAKIQGRVTVQGIAEVTPANLIELEGVGNRFNGTLFANAVRHQISQGDWVTDIQFGFNSEWFTETYDTNVPEASGLFPAVRGLQIGLVTQLQDDPENEERILVRLPMINQEEQGIWARVASLDAGENRGAFFRPEIGDEVIVGFINDDPSEAIVLGMLNSSAKPAPIVASDDNHEKGFFTRSEMKILFNDDNKSITISNK
ncbi:MAG TPA: type VI secretion system tip protein VgrG, partial [Phaeodactylibacter sp.]|nr:type VI secretion system tip protein VgrG [Phaeodactylibacter sp.]